MSTLEIKIKKCLENNSTLLNLHSFKVAKKFGVSEDTIDTIKYDIMKERSNGKYTVLSSLEKFPVMG